MKKLGSGFLSILLFGLFAFAISFTSCKEEPVTEKATVNIKLYDARVPQASTKTTTEGVVDSDQLTKCEITYSSIMLKNSDEEYVELLTAPKTVDLRNFQGTANDLVSSEIPVGTYTHIKITVSGVSTTYEGNNYTASTTVAATASIANPPQTFTQAQGVTNVFSAGVVVFEYPLAFTLSDVSDTENIHLQFDTDASVYVISYTYQTFTWNFAGIRPLLNIGVLLEEGIQQIRHSPPYGITIVSQNAVDYYGIHTFVDFDGNGGVINSHTSQHVFRGEDGTLTVNAEAMAVNPNPLSPNTVNANGESDITANETFNYSQIVSYLAGQGYTLVSGHTYYFSLRKTWNITTDGRTYDLTRMCEPIPVVIP